MSGIRGVAASLTARGRALLATGVVLLLAALVTGQRDLLRAGVLLVALPLAAGLLVARTRFQLACTRAVDPARTEPHRAGAVRLQLANLSRVPSGVLQVQDTLPAGWGRDPRFEVDRIDPGGSCELQYQITAGTRGRFTVGPLTVRLRDPFGVCQLQRSFTSSDELIVAPVCWPLPKVALGGDWLGGDDGAARTVASTGSDDAATREYRQGDDLRKVHWRSTARAGELMVRREEQPFQSRATLLLDNRLCGHRGVGADSSFEWAVSAVASVAVTLSRAGFMLHLLDAAGRPLTPPSVTVTQTTMTDSLAGVTTDRLPTLESAVDRLRGHGVDQVLVTVVGALEFVDAQRLARLRVGSNACIAVVLDVDSWAPTGGRSRAAALRQHDLVCSVLTNAGWRVLPADAGARLSQLWPQAAGRAVLPPLPLGPPGAGPGRP